MGAKQQCFFFSCGAQPISKDSIVQCAAISLLRDIVVGLGALISSRLSSSVTLHPLMPHMIQEFSEAGPTVEMLR